MLLTPIALTRWRRPTGTPQGRVCASRRWSLELRSFLMLGARARKPRRQPQQSVDLIFTHASSPTSSSPAFHVSSPSPGNRFGRCPPIAFLSLPAARGLFRVLGFVPGVCRQLWIAFAIDAIGSICYISSKPGPGMEESMNRIKEAHEGRQGGRPEGAIRNRRRPWGSARSA